MNQNNGNDNSLDHAPPHGEAEMNSGGDSSDFRLPSDEAPGGSRFTHNGSASEARLTDGSASEARLTDGNASEARFAHDGSASEARFAHDGSVNVAELAHDGGGGGNLSVLVACLLILTGVWSALSRVAPARIPGSAGGKEKAGVVAVIGVSGPIALSADSDPIGMMTSRGAEKIIYHLARARTEDRVKAVVLRIDSPGGTVAAAQEICAEIGRLKASGKKIVASFADVAASGGYYIAAGCDRIVANPGTITGSIGVIMNGIEFSGLMEKAGVSDITVKSGRFKDMGSPYRKVSPEEISLMSEIIEDVRTQFVEMVMTSRGLSSEAMAVIGDGRIMNGRQALDRKLVDSLGDLESAVSLAGELSGLGREPEVIHMKSSPFEAFFDQLGVTAGGAGVMGSGFRKSILAFFSGAMPSLLMPETWKTGDWSGRGAPWKP